jgi:hypothetical protein
MNQRAKKIHRDLIISHQWTFPHSPWQKPTELNGVKYLQTHAQVLLDSTGSPDNLWFPAKDFLTYVHNLSANLQQQNIKTGMKRGKAWHQTYPISWYFYWFEPVLYLDQNLFFPLHDAILFQAHGKSQAQDLQLGVAEFKVYHYVLLKTNSQVHFDRLLQLHMLDQTQEDNDMSLECHKVVDYCKKVDVNSSNHKCLVEWNDINKTKSWVNYFALSLSNPKPIISFARNNNLLDKMPFCHFTQYCRSNTAVDVSRIHKVSTSQQVSNTSLASKSPKESRMQLI